MPLPSILISDLDGVPTWWIATNWLLGVSVELMDTNFIVKNASKILHSTPVDYLKDVKLAGSLFDDSCTNGAVSCVFTELYVDHAELLATLEVFKTCERVA